MSYKIEITGDTVAEVAGKLLAMAAQMQTTVAEPRDAAPAAEKAPAKRKPAEPKATAPEPEAEPAEVVEEAAEVANEPEAPDYDTVVQPAILAAVAEHGKPAVVAVLTSMGVERASQLPVDRYADLLTHLKAIGA